MFTKFIFAKSKDEMYDLASTIEENKFKVKMQDNNFVFLRKNSYGNIFIHIVFIIVALVFYPYAIFVNLVYFLYNFYVNSIVIFVTTEKIDKDGNDIEFSDLSDIVGFHEGDSGKRDIFEDFKNVIKKSR